jgi:hypothetical protein
MSKYLIVLCFIGFTTFSFTQDEKEEKLEMEHKLSIASGITFVPKTINTKGDVEFSFVPTIGLDYNFDFHRYMGVGIINEIELGKYFIEKDTVTEIEREFAYTALLTFNVIPLKNWAIFIGGGAEIDKHKILPVISVGTEYEINFGQSWFGKVQLQYNYLFKYSSFAFGIGFGYAFGKNKKK